MSLTIAPADIRAVPAGTFIPETAPFAPGQRAWLNGFFAGLIAGTDSATVAAAMTAAAVDPFGDGDAGELVWHDQTIPLPERMELAADRPLRRKMMAAMAQQDCGQCGYDCENYANKLWLREETRLNLCAPGGKATQRMLTALAEELGAPTASTITVAQAVPGMSRDAPVLAKLAAVRRVSSPVSDKETNNVEIDLAGTGIEYVPGDSLGIVPANCADLVRHVGELIGSGEFTEELALRRCLKTPSDGLLALLAERAAPEDAARLAALAETDDAGGHDVASLLSAFPTARPPAADIVASLDALQPRLYSISSSLAAHPGQVHLTVAAVRWADGARMRKGVASTFLADRLSPGAPVGVYLQKAHGFGLPEPDTPAIMIGPGTGIAPFRSFLSHRASTGAPGRNWLFFGDRARATDFLYEDELAAWQATGVLTRLSLAFSRDQATKIYVQDRMREDAAELWAWLEAGAHVYVCGDAKRMAADVERALMDIAAGQGGMSDPKVWVKQLAAQGRYSRDVY